jgi:hypothetical protein
MKALNGSLKLISIASLAVLITAVGCSDSDKDPGTPGGEAGEGNGDAGKSSTAGSAGSAGTAGTAGTSSQGGEDGTGVGGDKGDAGGGGTTSGAGAPSGGAEAGGADSGAGGEGGGTGALATIAKFCNGVSFGGDDVTFLLVVGEGASQVTLEAVSGTCAPAACTEIPTGTDILVELFDKDDPTTALDTATIDIPAGEEVIFRSEVPNDTPVWEASTVEDGDTCAGTTYGEVFP